ncbi:Alkanesulfonate monooxygenase [Alphaproteobacteria bacterium SO-S41]|nr:Alkanesulfonate monooxygenase [Alphaproteobacteria bacterium SO-S41]
MTHHPLEFIGMIGTQNASETRRAPGGPGVIDKSFVSATARAHEYAGFDRVLIGYFSVAPDGFQVAAYAAHQTTSLKFLLAHRPGFVAPTLAARQLASLDQFADGRLAVHIITGGSDEEQARDGDFLTKDERYARTDDYLDVVKKTWTSTKPFDHDGPYYRVKDSFAAVRSDQAPHIPVYFGGSSPEAIRVAGKHADVYALWGESLAETRKTIAAVRAAAAVHGRERHIRFSLSLRPILGRTEDEAWARAARYLETAKALRANGPSPLRRPDAPPQNAGSQRLLAEAAKGKVVDKRLWTELAALTGAQGNSTSLVGTPEQVTEALLEYWDLGISTFLIRGFDPLEDALEYGRDLIPLVRAAVAQRQTISEAAE